MIDLFRRYLLLLGFFLSASLAAAEIEVASPQINASEDGYTVSANFNFELNSRLEDAVTKGLVLHFVVDFELSRPRWYWLDEKLVVRSQTYRLSYHALTRQYRVSTSGLHQSFATLSEALLSLSHLRGWQAIDKSDRGVRSGDSYQAALRMQLDISQLPRPFQISALGNKDWALSSDWKLWNVTLPALVTPEVAR